MRGAETKHFLKSLIDSEQEKSKDPALEDPELEKKLLKNKEEATEKLQKLVEEFESKQDTGDPGESHDDENSDNVCLNFILDSFFPSFILLRLF